MSGLGLPRSSRNFCRDLVPPASQLKPSNSTIDPATISPGTRNICARKRPDGATTGGSAWAGSVGSDCQRGYSGAYWGRYQFSDASEMRRLTAHGPVVDICPDAEEYGGEE